MINLIKLVIIIPLVVLTFIIFNEPGPIWFFALFLILYLLKDPIKKIISGVMPVLPIRYFLVGVIGGLFIECLAILNNLKLPAEQRVLFHPDPIPNLILGLGQYVALAIGSYFILRKFDFSLWEFFVFTGIFGVVIEEHGGILMQVLGGNILGGIYVFLSYASFLALPYMLFREDFNEFSRKKAIIPKYLIAILILALFYALFLLYVFLMTPIVGA